MNLEKGVKRSKSTYQRYGMDSVAEELRTQYTRMLQTRKEATMHKNDPQNE